MKKFLYWLKKLWFIIKKGFLVSMAVNDDSHVYELWCCVERPDGSTFNQCLITDLNAVPPKDDYVKIFEKNYFGKGYHVCKLWLQQK